MLGWCNVLARLHIYAVLRWCNVLARLHKDGSCRSPTNWSLLEPPQKICPSQMKDCTGPTISARFWDRIFQWIYTHIMSKWDMTTTCEFKLFVVWCRNWSLKKWQNVRRFGTWVSKTRGCVNPCYHVFSVFFHDYVLFVMPFPMLLQLLLDLGGPALATSFCSLPINPKRTPQANVIFGDVWTQGIPKKVTNWNKV